MSHIGKETKKYTKRGLKKNLLLKDYEYYENNKENLKESNISKTHKNLNRKTFFLSEHPNFKEYGKKSLSVLRKHLSNTRYLGFSEFYSSNVLRNSSYCWSIPKEKRMDIKQYKKLNDKIYNIPNFKSLRFTIQGYGKRTDFIPTNAKCNPSPDAYKIKSVFDINLMKKKGPIMTSKPKFMWKNARYVPGPGTYNITTKVSHGNIPIIIKSRQGFFYDDDLKQKKSTVSMQRYRPIYTAVERNRFSDISFGIGPRFKIYDPRYPGPGSYHVPGCFDRGLKGKLPLN